MQPKFTLKKFVGLIQKALIVFCIGMSAVASAQTVSTASGANYTGDFSIPNTNPLGISFVIQNTSGSAVALTSVSTQLGPFGALTPAGTPVVSKLFVSTTSLSGNYDLASPAWSQIGTGAAVVPAVMTETPVISGLNYIIPAGAQYRFVIEASRGLRFSGPFAGFPLPTPNTFTSGGIVLKVGDNQIAGQNIGYAGVSPVPDAGNTPAFFGGSVTFVSAGPCSGTPNPGNTLSSVPTVCSGINFTLNPQNSTPGSGVTYLWEYATSASGPWTPVPGGTSASLTTTQTVARFYRVTVSCGVNSGTSTPLQVLLTPSANCYCAAGGASAVDEKISRVQFNTIDNSSTTTPYEDFTSISTTVVHGQVIPITVNLSNGFSEDQILVWIDYNRNGNFSDPGEQVFVSAISSGPFTGSITIPVTASTGTTRMRIRLHDTFFGPLNNPCGTAPYGQVEDYTINIQPCVQGTFTTVPVNTTTSCSGNTTFSVVAAGSVLSYSWQFRVNASSPWQTVTNGGIYSGANTSTLTLLNVPSSMTGYQYRALISGPCTAVDFSSPPATLTVNPLVATVSPTTATICLGSVQQLTLTNPTSTPVYGAPSGLPLAIPDGSGVAAVSTIPVFNVPAGAVVSNISVTFTLPHTYVGDLDINLVAPNGNILNLVGALNDGNGFNSSNDFTNTVVSSTSVTPMSGAPAPRTGTFAADMRAGYGPLGYIQNTPNWAGMISILNGNWSLAIGDFVGDDVGFLNSWSINITYVAPPAQGVWTSTPGSASNTMFTNAGATVPYVAGSLANTIWVKPTATTVYSVVYSTATPCVSGPTNVTVNVVTPPTAVVNPTNKSACVGGSTTFTASATGGPFTYQWEVSTNGGASYTDISGATSASLTLNGITQVMNNNLYRVKIGSAPCAGGPVTTTAASLTVNALPTVTIAASSLALTPGQTTTLTASSTPAAGSSTSWTWFYNGAQIVTVPPTNTNSINVGIDQLGSYQARVTDVNGCVSLSNILEIGGAASDKLWIYPNPTDGEFQVRVFFEGPNADIRHISIYDASGKLVMRKAFDIFSSQPPYLQMNFDMTAFPAGTYVVKVEERFRGNIKSGLLIIQ